MSMVIEKLYLHVIPKGIYANKVFIPNKYIRIVPTDS